MTTNVLAIDLGASSGRAILCSFDGKKIELNEVHRFDNNSIQVNGTLFWDTSHLMEEIIQGILNAHKVCDFMSLGVDTWGVDFGLVSSAKKLIEPPVHYRDNRTRGMVEKVFETIDAKELYAKTGNQIMNINTLFQLMSLKEKRTSLLNEADNFLLMPDLFGYLLTGKKVAEVSIASTTQLLQPLTKQWNMELIQSLGLPDRLFPELVKSGTVLGQLSEEVCKELAIAPKKVISVAGHDTACAVAAVPANEKDFIFISCGTWSLLGTELDKPILTEKSSRYNLTNEVGYGDTTEFLSNIIGLWLIQETRRQFNREGKNYSYGDMEELALMCEPFAYFIDPDNEAFVPPGDIPGRIKEYCKATGQGEPASDGEIIRCIYDSLAMKYNYAYQRICDCTGKEYNTIHMVGGGSKDKFLCQLTANATGCEVLAGPVEATAFGNAAIQLMTLGLIPDIESARQIIKNSFTPVRYFPVEQQLYKEHYQKFKELIGK